MEINEIEDTIRRIEEFFTTDSLGLGGEIDLSNLTGPIERLKNVSTAQGVSELDLDRLLALVLDPRCPSKLKTNVLSCCYPRGSVSAKNVIKCFGSLGSLSCRNRSMILRWIWIIFDTLSSEAQTVLSQLSSIVFHYVDSDLCRPYVVLLLYECYRRDSNSFIAFPYRIRKMLEVRSRPSIGGSDKYLQLLCIIMRHSRPQSSMWALGSASSVPTLLSASSILEDVLDDLPEKKWRNQLESIREKYSNDVTDSATLGMRAFARSIVQTASQRKWRSLLFASSAGIPHFERVISQEVSLAHERSLLRGTTTAMDLISSDSSWLNFAMIESYGRDCSQSSIVISRVISFLRVVHAVPLEFERFLVRFIHRWNGEDFFDLISTMIEFLPPRPFSLIHRSLFVYIENFAFLTPLSATRTICMLFSMVRRWHDMDLSYEEEFLRDMTLRLHRICQIALSKFPSSSTVALAVTIVILFCSSSVLECPSTSIFVPPPSKLFWSLFVHSAFTSISVLDAMSKLRASHSAIRKFSSSSGESKKVSSIVNPVVMMITDVLWTESLFLDEEEMQFGISGFSLVKNGWIEWFNAIQSQQSQQIQIHSCLSLPLFPSFVGYVWKFLSNPDVQAKLSPLVEEIVGRNQVSLASMTQHDLLSLFRNVKVMKGFLRFCFDDDALHGSGGGMATIASFFCDFVATFRDFREENLIG